MRHKISKNKIILALIIIVCLSSLASNFKNVSKEKHEDRNIKLTVSTIETQFDNIQEKVKLTGSVLPEEEIRISSKASGNIVAIYVDSGDYVRQGQVLAKIDNSDLLISKQAAEAQLLEAKASSRITFNKSRHQEISGAKESEILAKAGIDVARSALKIAETNLNKASKDKYRYNTLFGQGAISAIDYDNAASNYDIALSQLNKAKADLARAEADYNKTKSMASLTYEGSRDEDKSIAIARVKSANANLNSIQEEIEDSYIKAPSNGYIVKRNIKLGSHVGTQDVAYILVKNSELELHAGAAESDIYKLHIGQPVDITSSINPSLKVMGKIKKIEPYIDPQTRMGSIKIALPKTKQINYGMFLNGIVTISNKKGIILPEEAVLFRNNKNIVFKLDNQNLAHETEVQLGARNTGKVEIISGLIPGEKVILDGAGFLYDGDKVSIINLNK